MEELLRINRRSFFKYGIAFLAASASSSFPNFLEAANSKKVKITILHTNDWHSRINSFPAGDRNYAGMGGAAARAVLIKKIRAVEENILLLDAGDIFQGTPYFNFYGGELEYKLMTEMGYDCVTLGNHDFDNGVEGLLKQLPHAGFKLVNCNYDFSETALSKIVKPYTIIQKQTIRIGILGVGIELKGLVPDKFIDNIQYLDPVERANSVASYLKRKEKCDLIVCLSHLGYQYNSDKVSDTVLAKRSENIDLIIGGHTHTFLDQPQEIINKIGKPVLVNQVGWAGLNLGRIDFYFGKNSDLIGYESSLNTIERKA